MDALPEECDVHGDAYEHIKIEDFGKAVLRGMGWDGKNNVDPSVYVSASRHAHSQEIKPRPERLGLGAMPLVVDKKVRNDAVKTTAAERAARRGYNGVKNEWGDAHSLRIGVQVPPEGAAGRGEAGEGLRSIGPDDAERPHAGPVVYQHLRQNTARGSHLAAAATALIQSSLFFEEGAQSQSRSQRESEERRFEWLEPEEGRFT